MKDTVLPNYFPVIVGENWKVEPVMLGESLVGPWIVDTNCDDVCRNLGEFAEAVSKRAHFFGANACKCAREECEDCDFACLHYLGEGVRFLVSVYKREGGGLFALFDHF